MVKFIRGLLSFVLTMICVALLVGAVGMLLLSAGAANR